MGLALATVADAMAARAGRRGQAVSGLQGQIAGREGRDRERAEREVLRQYRNKMKQFEFEQEGVRRRLAKEEKMEERAYRKGEKESEFQRMLKLAGGGGAAQVPPAGTIERAQWDEEHVGRRLGLRREMEDASLEALTTSGSQERIDLFSKFREMGMPAFKAQAELREAIARKRAAMRRPTRPGKGPLERYGTAWGALVPEYR